MGVAPRRRLLCLCLLAEVILSLMREALCADEEVDVAVDVAHEADVLEEGDAAAGFPDGGEDALDGVLEVRVGSGGGDGDGAAEHEVDHGLDAPGDVVLDDDLLAAQGAVVGDEAGGTGALVPCAEDARGEAAFLGEAVLAAGLARGAAGGHGVAEVGPEEGEARGGVVFVATDEGFDEGARECRAVGEHETGDFGEGCGAGHGCLVVGGGEWCEASTCTPLPLDEWSLFVSTNVARRFWKTRVSRGGARNKNYFQNPRTRDAKWSFPCAKTCRRRPPPTFFR